MPWQASTLPKDHSLLGIGLGKLSGFGFTYLKSDDQTEEDTNCNKKRTVSLLSWSTWRWQCVHQKETLWVHLGELRGPSPPHLTFLALFSKSIKKGSYPSSVFRVGLTMMKRSKNGPSWTYFQAWWSSGLLTKGHLLLWGIINGEGIPTGKHTSTLHLFSRVVNCYPGILCTQSVVHYT